MPEVVERSPYTIERAPTPRRWTRDEGHAMADDGRLQGRYELVEGEIISKTGQKPSHRIVVMLLHTCLAALFGPLFVQAQLPIDVAEQDTAHNEPEPDVAVTARPTTAYTVGNPPPTEVLLVAEVSDTSLAFDRNTKARLYARAGIPEYWVVDIAGRQVFVYRAPTADGYDSVMAFSDAEAIAPLACPDAQVRVADFLPPREA